MKRTPAYPSPALAVVLVALAVAPVPAQALDLTSYVQATVHFTKASTLREVGKDEEADRHRNRATGYLVAGLVLDAVGLVILTSGADRVERIEAELAAGRGPILDAYTAAAGVAPSEMAMRMRSALGRATAADEEVDLDALEQALADATLHESQAATWLYELHQEASILGVGATPRHATLAATSGVPLEAVAASVSVVLAEKFERSSVEGKVISARSVLANDAVATLNAVVDRIYSDHRAAVDAHLASLVPPS